MKLIKLILPLFILMGVSTCFSQDLTPNEIKRNYANFYEEAIIEQTYQEAYDIASAALIYRVERFLIERGLVSNNHNFSEQFISELSNEFFEDMTYQRGTAEKVYVYVDSNDVYKLFNEYERPNLSASVSNDDSSVSSLSEDLNGEPEVETMQLSDNQENLADLSIPTTTQEEQTSEVNMEPTRARGTNVQRSRGTQVVHQSPADTTIESAAAIPESTPQPAPAQPEPEVAVSAPQPTPIQTIEQTGNKVVELSDLQTWQVQVIESLLSCKNFSAVLDRFNKLKAQRKINKCGGLDTYSSAFIDGLYLVLFNPDNTVFTVLGPGSEVRYNFREKRKVSFDQYKGKGISAMWFSFEGNMIKL